MPKLLTLVNSTGLPATLGGLLLQANQQWCMCLQQGERASSRMGH